KKSPTYGNYEAVRLSAENKLMLWIPEGFAHAYLSLENNTIFQYKCSRFYNKESECSIIWNDPDLNVQWGIDNPIVSDKDLQGVRFRELVSPF
ncbi:MAG: dTDP-4-dehydrorhamnose 3,5-epimerase family protein, partial [Bacteroidales bacterium]